MKYLSLTTFIFICVGCASPIVQPEKLALDSAYRVFWSTAGSARASADSDLARLDTLYSPTVIYAPERLALWHAWHGFLLAAHGNRDSATLSLNRAIELLPDAVGVDTIMAIERFGRFRVYLGTSKYDSILAIAPETYTMVKGLLPHQFIAYLDELCNVYMMANDTVNINSHIQEGLRLAPSQSWKFRFLTYQAVMYDRRRKTDSALFVFQNSLKDTLNTTPFDRAIIYGALAHFTGQKGEVDRALFYGKQSVEFFHEAKMPQADAYGNVAGLYRLRGEPSRSLPYYDSAIYYAEFQKDYLNGSMYSRMAGDVAKKLGFFDKALDYYVGADELRRVSDSVSLNLKTRAIETAMGVKLKDEQIRTVAVQKEAAEATARQRIFVIGALGILIVFSALIAILLFKRQRLARTVSELQLEQRLLRVQMEPHFMFNILSQAIALISDGRTDKAQRLLGKFARLLRLVLVNTRKSMVTLRDEIETLENYLYLQQVNSDNAFTATIDAYDGYEEEGLLIPPMLLQPFVENALYHGVFRRNGHGEITIRITRDESFVHFSVQDNGPGLRDDIERQPKKSSVATDITRDRLGLLSKQTGKKAALNVTQRPDGNGVLVEMSIPFRRGVVEREAEITMHGGRRDYI